TSWGAHPGESATPRYRPERRSSRGALPPPWDQVPVNFAPSSESVPAYEPLIALIEYIRVFPSKSIESIGRSLAPWSMLSIDATSLPSAFLLIFTIRRRLIGPAERTPCHSPSAPFPGTPCVTSAGPSVGLAPSVASPLRVMWKGNVWPDWLRFPS